MRIWMSGKRIGDMDNWLYLSGIVECNYLCIGYQFALHKSTYIIHVALFNKVDINILHRVICMTKEYLRIAVAHLSHCFKWFLGRFTWMLRLSFTKWSCQNILQYGKSPAWICNNTAQNIAECNIYPCIPLLSYYVIIITSHELQGVSNHR